MYSTPYTGACVRRCTSLAYDEKGMPLSRAKAYTILLLLAMDW